MLNSKFVKLAGMCYNDQQMVFHDALSMNTMHPAYSLTISSTALYVALAMTSMCSCGTLSNILQIPLAKMLFHCVIQVMVG